MPRSEPANPSDMRINSMRKLLLPMLAATLFLTGCGDQLIGPGRTLNVSVTNAGFTPQTMTVPRGATVQWTNNSNAAHRIVGPANAWDSGQLQPGATFSHEFRAFGTFTYTCTLHGETGNILVD
jgi:plastocyanin